MHAFDDVNSTKRVYSLCFILSSLGPKLCAQSSHFSFFVSIIFLTYTHVEVHGNIVVYNCLYQEMYVKMKTRLT